MNGLLVMAYIIINIVGSMQYILIEYVVGSKLVCSSQHSHSIYINAYASNLHPVSQIAAVWLFSPRCK